MIRLSSLLLLSLTLAFSGCKKPALGLKPSAATPVPGGASTTAAAASSDSHTPAAPEKPDFTPPPSGAATPKPAAKPLMDANASAIALCYHNIEDGKSLKALTITVAEFEREMKAIKDAGFTVIPLQDFLAWRRGEKSIAKKSCIITIDDGWVSGYTNAWPILKKYGYPFTMFIYINYVGTGGKSMSWDQLAELRDAGVDIECHTYSHSNLRAPGTGVDKKTAGMVRNDLATLGKEGWLRKEIIESKKVLQERLGIRVNALAYPFGIYTQEARNLVKEAGYEAAFTVYGQRLTHSSPSDLLGRYAVEASKPKIFTDALAMIGGGVSAAESASAPNVAQLAAASMVTQPLNGETITNPQPTIKANLATMGDIDASTLEVRLSGVGPLKPQFNADSKMMTAEVPQKLRPDMYTVIIAAHVNGQRAETRWNFTVAQTAGSVLSATPAPAPGPETTPVPKAAPKKKK